MNVGAMTVDPVIDGTGSFDPTKSFRGSTTEEWAAHRDLLDAEGKLGFSIGGFLVRGAGRTTLVDLGVGRTRFLGIDGGRFLESLSDLGVPPSEVTDVIFTHLHFDHVGWAATASGQPTFPNATYRCHAADWDYFLRDHPDTVAELIHPVAERFESWAGSGPLLPGVDTLAAPGHTPGSTVVVVSSESQRAIMLGDVVHCPVQLVDDEWGAIGDVDPELAVRTRTALSRELEGSDTPVARRPTSPACASDGCSGRRAGGAGWFDGTRDNQSDASCPCRWTEPVVEVALTTR